MSDSSLVASRRAGLRTAWRVRAAVAVLVAAVVALIAGSAAAQGARPAWNVARVGAPAASGAAVVAVVDTGVDASHPAFGDRILPQLDFTGDREAGDPQGHGTHVAGTVAGGTIDCGQGPTAIGVAPDVRILPVRVLDGEGSGRVSDVVAGIRAAAARGATVINLSLGGDLSFLDGGGQQFRDAVNDAWAAGSIPVLAAGNSGLLGSIFGSGYQGLDAVVVTASTNRDRHGGYASSVGSAKWGITAPGGDGSGELGRDILSAHPDDRCAVLGGTSMAAPHVSGALAVLRSHGLSPAEAVERLLDTATPIGPSSTFGAGLLDLRAAMSALDLDVEVSDAASAPPSPSTTGVVAPAPTTVPAPAAPAGATTTETTPGTSTTAEPATTVAESTTTSTTSEPATVTGEEVAAAGQTTDDPESPSPLLVMVALAACVATSSGAWRLRRAGRQP